VQVIDLGKSEYIEKSGDEIKFNIAKEVLERKIINVPVMKTNSQLGISGAIENMLRVVDEKTQMEMFAEDIENTLPKLIKTLPNFVTIGDATIGMQGQGPTLLGEPAFLNMLFVSKDPAALDSVFCEVGMFPRPRYIETAFNINSGNTIDKLEILGNDLEAIKYHMKAPDKEASAHPRIKLIDGKSNPLTFNTILKISSKLAGLSGHEVNIAIGKFLTKDMVMGKKRIIAYGNDAINKLREMNVTPAAEIPEDIDKVEKLMLIKSILENQYKKSINGYAIGGGNELAMACDIRVGSQNAKFMHPETSLGTVAPLGGTKRLPRLIGLGRAKYMLFTGDTVDSKTALEWGLIDFLVPKDKIDSFVQGLATNIIEKPAKALELTKKSVNENYIGDLRDDFEVESYVKCSRTKENKDILENLLRKKKSTKIS